MGMIIEIIHATEYKRTVQIPQQELLSIWLFQLRLFPSVLE